MAVHGMEMSVHAISATNNIVDTSKGRTLMPQAILEIEEMPHDCTECKLRSESENCSYCVPMQRIIGRTYGADGCFSEVMQDRQEWCPLEYTEEGIRDDEEAVLFINPQDVSSFVQEGDDTSIFDTLVISGLVPVGEAHIFRKDDFMAFFNEIWDDFEEDED